MVLQEPLVHFLALGAVIFVVNAVRHPARRLDEHRIEITKADVARIRALYTQQWGAQPGEDETPRLVDDYLRSEILFREGMALGLDVDDSVLRNRIIQKMEFLIEAPSAAAEPTDAEVATYYREHPGRYRLPTELAFEQIYFSPSLRGPHAKRDARAVLHGLKKAVPRRSAAPSNRGDPSMFPRDTPLETRDDVERDFGSEFATAVFALPAGAWEGPLESAIGWHLVRVLERVPAHLSPLSEIHDRVRMDLTAARQRRTSEAAYARIRARYQIVMDPDALGTRERALAALRPR